MASIISFDIINGFNSILCNDYISHLLTLTFQRSKL